MTDRAFTTPESPSEYPSEYPSTAENGFGDSTVAPHTTSTYAEAQVAASPAESTSTASTREMARETAATAKDEARTVAADAKESTKHVAETAKTEARDVAAQTQQQARALYHQLRSEVTDQASGQSQRAASGLRALADELGEMGNATQQRGVASDVARQASDRARGFADWLDQREPGDILDEARDFARRRPGTFLAAAAALGFLGGRMTRGLADDDSSSPSSAGSTQSFESTTPTYGGEPYAAETAPGAYETFATNGMAGTSGATAGYSDRVDAGIDPATYSHADPTHAPAERAERVQGSQGGDYGQELR
jgi:hypothetical protein